MIMINYEKNKKRFIFLVFFVTAISINGCIGFYKPYTESRNKSYQNVSSNQKHNIQLNSQSRDFGKEIYSNNAKGCGYQKYQKGDRKRESVLYLTGEDFIVKGGIFDCSLQNTIFVKNAKNLVIEQITSSRGSDNPIEIRDSFVFVKDSIFEDSYDNKCVETENGIVIFYNNIFSNCKNGFDMELTSSTIYTTNKYGEWNFSSLNYSAAVFLENNFSKIRDDAFHCHDRRKDGKGNVYLFLKNNEFSGQSGYTFRKFGKKKDCLKIVKISTELEKAIKSNNLNSAFSLIKNTVEDLED